MTLGLSLNRNLILKENLSILNSRIPFSSLYSNVFWGEDSWKRGSKKGRGSGFSQLKRPTSRAESLNQISFGKYLKSLQLKQEVVYFVLEFFQ